MRSRPTFFALIRPAFPSIRVCLTTAGRLIANPCANSPARHGFCASRRNSSLRVESPSATIVRSIDIAKTCNRRVPGCQARLQQRMTWILRFDHDDRSRCHAVATAQRAEALRTGGLQVEQLRIGAERAREVDAHLDQVGR